jgi:hypothetical protein
MKQSKGGVVHLFPPGQGAKRSLGSRLRPLRLFVGRMAKGFVKTGYEERLSSARLRETKSDLALAYNTLPIRVRRPAQLISMRLAILDSRCKLALDCMEKGAMECFVG